MKSPISSLLKETHQLADRIVASALRMENVATLLEECSDAAYLKDHDGKVAMSNTTYSRLFGNGKPTLGRSPTAYLDRATAEIAVLSDKLLAAGCSVLTFEHETDVSAKSTDTEAPSLHFATVKINLRKKGLTGLACLGVTRQLGPASKKAISLQKQWRRFESLPVRRQNCAVLLAKGMSQREAAKQLEVSRRTIENDCRAILERLQLENTHQLAQLLVRIQEHGLADLSL